jgi:hypothetical protein
MGIELERHFLARKRDDHRITGLRHLRHLQTPSRSLSLQCWRLSFGFNGVVSVAARTVFGRFR